MDDKRKRGTGHAKAGGEVAASNAHFYKGGQFLPSTSQPPGTYKVGKTVLRTGKEQVAPGEWEEQPTPLHRSIYGMLGAWLQQGPGDHLSIRPDIRTHEGEPVTAAMKVRPGVKGIMSTEEHSLGDLVKRYNSGERWVEVKPPSNLIGR